MYKPTVSDFVDAKIVIAEYMRCRKGKKKIVGRVGRLIEAPDGRYFLLTFDSKLLVFKKPTYVVITELQETRKYNIFWGD